MYFVEPPFQIPNPIVPNVIYHVEPIINNTLDVDVLHQLLVEQEDISVKLSQLFVKLHNASVECTDNIIPNAGDILSEKNLNDAQDILLQRLLAVEVKVDKIALENGIDIKNISELDLLESEQNCLFSRVENLNTKVDDCARVNNVSLTAKVQPCLNMCVMADPANPPLSLILLLGYLRSNGRQVACLPYIASPLVTRPPESISKYIAKSLPLVDPRHKYDVIIDLIWKEGLVSQCITSCDSFSDIPFFGEMMSLLIVVHYLGIDVPDLLLSSMRHINDQLHSCVNIKTALASLNNKLYKELHTNSLANVVFGTFVASSLVRSASVGKVNAKMKEALQTFMAQCPLDIASLSL